MMKPEVYTERGRMAQQRAEMVMQQIVDHFGFYISWIVDHPDTDRPRLPVDGFISKGNKLIYIFEARTRNAQLINDQLVYNGKAYDSLIVTHSKLIECARYCRAFDVPLQFFVILNNATLNFSPIDNYGEFRFPIETRHTKTAATINGGEKVRVNAFLPIKTATKLDFF